MAAAAVALDGSTLQQAMEVGKKQSCFFMVSESLGLLWEGVICPGRGSLPSPQLLLPGNDLTRRTQRRASFKSRWSEVENQHPPSQHCYLSLPLG